MFCSRSSFGLTICKVCVLQCVYFSPFTETISIKEPRILRVRLNGEKGYGWFVELHFKVICLPVVSSCYAYQISGSSFTLKLYIVLENVL